MKLWACFVCDSLEICAHREPELVAWVMSVGMEEAWRSVELAQVGELVERAKHGNGREPVFIEAKEQETDWHGTLGGYTNHGCRCERCCRCWNAYMRNYSKSARERKKQSEWRRAA